MVAAPILLLVNEFGELFDLDLGHFLRVPGFVFAAGTAGALAVTAVVTVALILLCGFLSFVSGPLTVRHLENVLDRLMPRLVETLIHRSLSPAAHHGPLHVYDIGQLRRYVTWVKLFDHTDGLTELTHNFRPHFL